MLVCLSHALVEWNAMGLSINDNCWGQLLIWVLSKHVIRVHHGLLGLCCLVHALENGLLLEFLTRAWLSLCTGCCAAYLLLNTKVVVTICPRIVVGWIWISVFATQRILRLALLRYAFLSWHRHLLRLNSNRVHRFEHPFLLACIADSRELSKLVYELHIVIWRERCKMLTNKILLTTRIENGILHKLLLGIEIDPLLL